MKWFYWRVASSAGGWRRRVNSSRERTPPARGRLFGWKKVRCQFNPAGGGREQGKPKEEEVRGAERTSGRFVEGSEGEETSEEGQRQTRKRLLETVRGELEGSLLLGDERGAVEVSVYFCRLSFQGPDWQLFLEQESHSLLNGLSREEEGVGGRCGGGGLCVHTHIHWCT